MNRGFYSIPRNRTYKEPTLNGINIPQPISYRSTFQVSHNYNTPLPGTPGTITNSWNDEMLKLTYQTSDLTFLNYNPKYFLFVYQGSHKFGKSNNSYPNTRINNNKFGKYFSHPVNAEGSKNAGITYIPTYTNFSGHGHIDNTQIDGDFNKYRTEWDLLSPIKYNSNTGQPTILTGFNPLRWYWTNYTYNRGDEFFPWPISNITGLSVATIKSHTRWPSGGNPHPRVNLYIKFAIVIQNPFNTKNYLIGPMSDTIKIFPKSGYFDDGGTNKYYYAWGTKIV